MKTILDTQMSRRDFVRTTGQVGLGAALFPLVDRTEEGEIQVYAAGQVRLPFSYTVSRSSAVKPAGLDFSQQPGPDNCQVFVRMGDETWEFRSQWIIGIPSVARYRGSDIDHMRRVEDGKYPDGMDMCWFLGGMWYDEEERKLYAPMHVEQDGIRRSHPVAPWGCRKIVLATSTDQGRTWRYEGDIITSETYYYSHEAVKFSGADYCNGVADFGFYVDKRGGYFYIFPDEAWLRKGTMAARWSVRAARCRLSDKMAPGSWRYFYDRKWKEPALGGKSSTVAPSHLWGIIYSSYLDKYLCVFPANQDPPTPNTIDGVYIGCCSDLGNQEWVWGYCPELMFGFLNLMNAEGTDVARCDRTFRCYSYWDKSGFERVDVTLEHGSTMAMDLRPRYLFEPHPESSDSMLGRKTRIVGAANRETIYSGAWTDHVSADSFQGVSRKSTTPGSSVEFVFAGSAVYWRAVMSPASGKADIYIDGLLSKTVDCYSPQSTTFEQFPYVRTGLSPNEKHVIKLVVRGQKNVQSAGVAINHIAFEYSAESYKASAGFCSLMGKNNWCYQLWNGTAYSDLQFVADDTEPKLFWFGPVPLRVGPDYQIPGSSAAVRKWVAPHGGVVRIEGRVAVATSGGGGVLASIRHNGTVLWPARTVSSGQPVSHDFTVTVEQGDAVCFTAGGTGAAAESEPDKLFWDPTITYLRSVSAVWRANPTSVQNLALNKYARSKTLVSSYSPFDGVDGKLQTAFTITADDKISSGDDWFLVDLDVPRMMDRYVVVFGEGSPAYLPRAFTLQSSEDGFVWTTVDSVTDTASTRVERNVPPFRGRYVRLYLPRGKPFSIGEFELYHTGNKG